MISATVVGRIGDNAEIKHVGQNSSAVLKFSVASSAFQKDAPPTWVRVSAWGDRFTKLAEYLHKGDRIAVTGRLELRAWESNGKSGTDLEMNASDIALIETASESQAKASNGSGAQSRPAPAQQPQNRAGAKAPF